MNHIKLKIQIQICLILWDTLATSISSGGVMGDVGEAGAVILRLGCDSNVKFGLK